jgi:hypothetical protein
MPHPFHLSSFHTLIIFCKEQKSFNNFLCPPLYPSYAQVFSWTTFLIPCPKNHIKCRSDTYILNIVTWMTKHC